jgi:hypothetical protein
MTPELFIYTRKVSLLADVLYEIPEEVIEEYAQLIKKCYDNNFSPRRTTETLAKEIF